MIYDTSELYKNALNELQKIIDGTSRNTTFAPLKADASAFLGYACPYCSSIDDYWCDGAVFFGVCNEDNVFWQIDVVALTDPVACEKVIYNKKSNSKLEGKQEVEPVFAGKDFDSCRHFHSVTDASREQLNAVALDTIVIPENKWSLDSCSLSACPTCRMTQFSDAKEGVYCGYCAVDSYYWVICRSASGEEAERIGAECREFDREMCSKGVMKTKPVFDSGRIYEEPDLE